MREKRVAGNLVFTGSLIIIFPGGGDCCTVDSEPSFHSITLAPRPIFPRFNLRNSDIQELELNLIAEIPGGPCSYKTIFKTCTRRHAPWNFSCSEAKKCVFGGKNGEFSRTRSRVGRRGVKFNSAELALGSCKLARNELALYYIRGYLPPEFSGREATLATPPDQARQIGDRDMQTR